MAQVLLVDDDPEMRRLLCAVLQDTGHTILEAADGMEALATLDDSMVSLIVVLDWQMPRLDGFGVLRAIAGNPHLAERHRFVLVTAQDVLPDSEGTALPEHLQVPVIQKPFDVTVICQAVEHAMICLARYAIKRKDIARGM